jgi:integrase
MNDPNGSQIGRKRKRAYGTGGIFKVTNQQGDVTYYISYRAGGKTVKESTGSNREADAQRLLQRRMAEAQDGELAGSPLRVKVGNLLDDLLTDYRVHERASLKTVTTHIEGKEYGLRKVFGHMKATVVKKPLLTKTIEHWKSLGLMPATINKHLGTLSRAYNLGVENGRISKSAVPDFPRLPENNARQTYVGVADMRNIIAAMPDDGTRDFVDWLYGSSQRWGEASEMTWDMLHDDTWEIHIPGLLCKNRLPRILPVHQVEHLRPIIERRQVARRLDYPYIFHRNGREFQQHWLKVWRKACEEAGFVGKRDGGITPHDLRHIAATDMRRAGIPESIILKIGGWETDEMFRRYAITDTQEMADNLGKLSTYRTAQAKQPAKVVPMHKTAKRSA